jgi:hypothetical protein
MSAEMAVTDDQTERSGSVLVTCVPGSGTAESRTGTDGEGGSVMPT